MSLPTLTAVVDTNVLISGLISSMGPSAQILQAVAKRTFTMVTAEPLLDELEIVTLRADLEKRFPSRPLVEFWSIIREGAIRVTPAAGVSVTEDPVDNTLFTTAVAAGAQCIVTGDKKVLAIGSYAGIAVLTPRDFLAWLARHR